jgi:hypothetical protein
MAEVFAGAMLPMIEKSLPDFGPAFEAFARDLEAAAEGARRGPRPQEPPSARRRPGKK